MYERASFSEDDSPPPLDPPLPPLLVSPHAARLSTATMSASRHRLPIQQPPLTVLSRGTGHDHRNIGGRVLAAAVKRSGLGTVEIGGEIVQHAPTFHDLRHSHASALIAQGWDIES